MSSSAPQKHLSDAQPLWKPSDKKVEHSNLTAFVQGLGAGTFSDYHELWRWTNENPEKFWDHLWDFAGVIGEKGERVLINKDQLPGAEFFPDSKINYAENMLKNHSDDTAIIFRDEQGKESEISFSSLYEQVSKCRQYLSSLGVKKGDRVAGYLPNMPETIIAALASASLGAIWSSASPDFGAQGLIDRFSQIEPKVVFCVNAYYYNGKTHDCLAKVKELQPTLKGLVKTIVIPFTEDKPDISSLDDAILYTDALEKYEAKDIVFERVEFNHPLFIMFSSGTTGIPKCIVHGHGGTLLQHMKEHILQCDVKKGDNIFYFTTCGWMMWNWLITGLACDATLLLFDGSPFYPDGNVLWEFTSKHKCKMFGTSAKYIDALKNFDIYPARDYDLSALEILTSTGSPLMHESFDFVYEHIKEDLHLASIYGGTDIISASFGIGNPWSPVWRGELQGAALATPVNVFDDEGREIPEGGGAGELVCTGPIPSMPVGFWNDPDGKRYKAAYFDRFENVWQHGDWVEKTVHHGLIVHGRSDATLNPGGVRIGTAEIYRQVEQVEGILESIAVGQDYEGDVRVVLFVRLDENTELTDDLKKTIKSKIRSGASPRHVPAVIVDVSDIPRTKSGKIVELAVRDVIHGRKVKNVEALANPEALELYKNLSELS
ncbi:MAG: acetoacetate--CoA ligase [Micavibrio sp.]|nr:acetoacetate--CoA ligase [Micavibrio sp.]